MVNMDIKRQKKNSDKRTQTSEDRKIMRDSETLRWIAQQTRGHKFYILFMIVVNAVDALLSVSFALVSKRLIDSAAEGVFHVLVRTAFVLLAVLASQILLDLLARTIDDYVYYKLRLSFQRELLERLLQRKYDAMASYHSGDLSTRMFSDVDIVVDGMISMLPSAARLIFRLISASVVLLMLTPRFTFMLLASGVLLFLTITFFRKKLKYLHKRLQEERALMRSFIQETLENILIIKVFDACKPVERKVKEYQDNYFRAAMKRRALKIASHAGLGLVFDMGYFLVMVWGCYGIFSGAMTYGTLAAMLQLVGQIQSPFSGFSSLISEFYSVLASAERLIELEQLPEEAGVSGEDPNQLYQRLNELNVEDVSFTYGRTPVLIDVSFRLKKGDFVSVTGISGGGKSTLFLLLLGMYQPTKGKIQFLFECEPHTAMPGAKVRRLFAYVPQGNQLFSGTLRENLTIFRMDASDEAIWQALDIACAKRFVQNLPQGLETLLGEKGHGLSVGQLQRLAIARAILSNAPILLLDEATSALDEETEAQLLWNIALLRNHTCLIVTHRKAALDICNRHLFLKNGHIQLRETPLPPIQSRQDSTASSV